jgi:PIN domain nuclease of toxin-antitoxin system
MRLLLDTHVLLDLTREGAHKSSPRLMKLLAAPTTESYASAASLWEIAIKTRLGKLDPGMALEDLAGYLEAIGLTILPIERRHAVCFVEPEPPTRDPFDGMLLTQCEVEGLRLATIDRALAAHPLAVRFEQ